MTTPRPGVALLERRTDQSSRDISIIVPTRNEGTNVRPLTDRVIESMAEVERSWELIFVDDSDEADPTPGIIEKLSEQHSEVKLIHRPPKRRRGGLAGAVTTGFNAARGRALVVMDGDLQHPPDMAKDLATAVLSGRYDVAVGSRYVPGASAEGLDNRWRRICSKACIGLVRVLVPRSRQVRDPMSGFFAVSATTLRGARLRPNGFKILLEILARTPVGEVAEVPFRMQPREGGESKAGLKEGIRFLQHLSRLVTPRPAALLSLVTWLVLQVPLAGILAVQAWLSYRLVYRNTAFVDEATYISAGHFELYQWAHGGPDMHLATYFSGAPPIYPVLAGLADQVGGLAAARYLSMAFLLVTTMLGYAAAKRLWGRPAGWLAAGVYVTTQGVQFLGAFATYDAMALMLIALAAYLVVRFASLPKVSNLLFVSIPAMLLANATKYATALFDPVIVAVGFFVLWDHVGLRRAARTTLMLLAGLVGATATVLAAAPHEYVTGLLHTTVERAAANAPRSLVLHDSWSWVGAIACIAAAATLIASAGFAARRVTLATAGLIAVLALAVVLAPANQARIHTTTSLSKHVTFGAWFGAVGCGWLLGAVAGRRPRSPWRLGVAGLAAVVAGAALIPMGVAGTHQARALDGEWPRSTAVVDALRPLVAGQNQPVLMDNAEVARYYLQDELSLPHWIDTFYFAYTPPGSRAALVDGPAYAAAIRRGYFSVIALDYGEQIRVDRVIAQAVHDSGRYSWVGDYTDYDAYGRDTYVVWKVKPTSPARPA
jgi:glycosyltransferase involved in cell wall biosynthesis